MSKTQKMKFSKDMFYTDQNVPLYTAGKVYDVEENMIARWLKRGGELVEDKPEVQEPKSLEAEKEKVEDKPTPAPQSKPKNSGSKK